MKRTTFTMSLALCVSLLATGAAMARSGYDGRSGFEQIDANGDGQISRAEMDNLWSRHLGEADANEDSVLSLEELETHESEKARSRAQKMMKRMDQNKDGVLSEEEVRGGKRAGRGFDRADRDEDGFISKAEFDDMRHRKGKHKSRDD